jgi:putative spermidine/putrescine transport system ATP-binding protein
MTSLSIQSLKKRFGASLAVNEVSLDIRSGEFVSLLGPSGCGKTTTLRCIAGLEEPDAGAIQFDGCDVLGLPPEARDTGMVFQNYALFPHMTVAQNLSFGLEMRKVARTSRSDRVGRVLEIVQLAGMLNRFPRQLSGGQQQRVALARALVIEPKLLLLDEPLANLDAKLREEMRFFIRSLQRRTGITTVYVTHDQAEAMIISDRIAVMFDGRIEQLGAPDEIYRRPTTRRVASFIGVGTFLEGRVVSASAEGIGLETGVGRFHAMPRADIEVGASASLLVRPEAIAFSATAGDAPPTTGANRLRATVWERHFLGETELYRMQCENGQLLDAYHDSDERFEVGQNVWCSFSSTRSWVVPS